MVRLGTGSNDGEANTVTAVARTHLMAGEDERLRVELDEDLDGLALTVIDVRPGPSYDHRVETHISFIADIDGSTPTERLLRFVDDLHAQVHAALEERLATVTPLETALGRHPSNGPRATS